MNKIKKLGYLDHDEWEWLVERFPDTPLLAQDIVTDTIKGQKVESSIDANYVAWRVLQALRLNGFPVYWHCPGCCNCAPSNFTDPICDGKGDPLR